MPRAAALLALAVLVAAGCGVRTSKPFTAAGTAPCLRDKGFTGVTTDPQKIGFIAGIAENGGLRATAPSGNVVTIAFAADADSVGSSQQAFKRFAPPRYRVHIADIMRTERNAVMVWTVTPGSDEYTTVRLCLKP